MGCLSNYGSDFRRRYNFKRTYLEGQCLYDNSVFWEMRQEEDKIRDNTPYFVKFHDKVGTGYKGMKLEENPLFSKKYKLE